MVTLGEAIRFVVYRLNAWYYRVLRRLLRGDRLLWGSERKFRALLDSAPDAVVIVDWHGHISHVNAQAERLFDYRGNDLLGQPIGVLIPERLRAVHREHLKTFGRHPTAREMGGGHLDLLARRRDGSEFPVEISLGPLETTEGLLVSAAIRDVTVRRREIAELAAAEALFRGAFDGSPIGKALSDEEGRLVRVNAALCDIIGHSAAHLSGTTLADHADPDSLPDGLDRLARLVGGDLEHVSAELRLVHAAGHAIDVAVHASSIPAPEEDSRRYLFQLQDITYRKRYENDLEYLATHDPLTGLHNRASFARRLQAHAELASRYGAEGAVLLLDLDHFKYINDTLGHQAGDQLIARVAGVLSSRLRESDVLARIGGDEFAALLPRGNRETAEHVANDLLEALRGERIAVPGTRDRTITASIGVATFADDEIGSGEDVLVSADLAMYDAKEAGRNQIAVYRTDEHAQARMKGRITWAERIAVAIEEERFVLVAQPIVDLATGRATQFEVLLRMQDERGDHIPPGSFLYIAERLGMINRIDMMTVSNALRAVAAATDLDPTTAVEINLSGASTGDPALLRLIEDELRETGIDPHRVIFEITETAAIANMGQARAFSRRLSELGCRFALDDFGAGFGSFYYLKHVAFDILKIDGEFVRDCLSSETDRLLVEAVVGIARGLGKKTVAEHVGDAETAELLARLGVDMGQGYHLGRPILLEEYLRGGAETPAPLAEPGVGR